MPIDIIMVLMQLGSSLTLPSGATLPNRIAKAAMSETLGDPTTGAPTDGLVRVYERWGRGGAGLLLTGNVMVDPLGLGEPGNVVIVDDRHLAGLRRWADAAQANGSRLWMQINHAGRQAPKKLVAQPVAPSAVAMRGAMKRVFAPPRALTGEEIEQIVQRFATAAAVAKEAGFAGVQLHGAHGYLISQFLSPRTNQRDDAWGGDAARRSRFLLALVEAVRGAVGPAFPIGVKLNSADFQRGGFTIEEAMDVARALEHAGAVGDHPRTGRPTDAAGTMVRRSSLRSSGIDLLEVSGGNYESPAMAGSGEMRAEQRASSVEREAYFLDYARRIRGVTATPIMLTGGMRSRAVMDEVLASGAVDVVGIGRPLAHTPDLPARLLDGTLAAAPVVRIRSRVRALDDALQAIWFQQQIHRMARGQEPDLKASTWLALWRGMTTNFISLNPFRKKPVFDLGPAPAPVSARRTEPAQPSAGGVA